MSYIMHTQRQNCLAHIKKILKEKQKMTKADLKKEIMINFDFAAYTADKYISDIVAMGIARINNDHIIYIPLPGEKLQPKKEIKKW